MPVPHLNIRIVQRSKGKSAVAGAAFRVLFYAYEISGWVGNEILTSNPCGALAEKETIPR